MGYWCRIAVLTVALAAFAFAPTVAAGSPSTSDARFEADLEGISTGGTAWCCGELVQFKGTGTVRAVGGVGFTGQWLHGCSFPSLPTPCFQRLELTLVTRNGDRLVIRGDNEWTLPFDPAPAALTWTTDPASSSGRLARIEAAGTYTVVGDGPAIELSLAGTRQKATIGAQ
jgi:hypothetical protein